MKPVVAVISFLLVFLFSAAQQKDKRLQRQVEELLREFHGDVGVYIKDLKSNRIVAVNQDTIFPTASIVKIPILVGVMHRISKGELNYHKELHYHDSLLYPGVDILGSFRNGEKIELSKLIMLMMTMSDNTASLWLQALAGSGLKINTLMDSLGFSATKVNSKTPGREHWRSQYGWGQSTPKEMVVLMQQIYEGKIISGAASERMLRALNRNYWDAEAISQIPPYASIFSKNGAVDRSRSEVVLVRGVKSLYVFCISTKNNADTSWTENNEAWKLTRKLSNLLWNYFEPKHQWHPSPDAARFR
jgi:beta-lactamase class A